MSIGSSVMLPPSTTGMPAARSSWTVAGVWLVPVRYSASTRRDRKLRTSVSSFAAEKPDAPTINWR
ncbi:MAG: hypothetical protein C6Y20_16265 [Tagaea sp. CACIAM 22H2]|nr:hypothetical protein [Tagaea sp. CACIAM 22H2]